MSRSEFDVRETRAAEGPAMIAAMRRGVVAALREHKSQGVPIVVWDSEKRECVEVPPEQIEIPEGDSPPDRVNPEPAGD